MTEKQSKQDMQKILDEVVAIGKKQAEAYQAKISDNLAKMRAQLDSMLESVTTELQESSLESPEHQSLFDSLREKLSGAHGADETASEDGNALEEARQRIQELERQIQESPNNHVQRHIQELEQNLEKRNETINIARRRILRLQEKIEGMAADRATALQRVADFEMQLERKNAALQASEERFTDLRRKFDLKMGGNEALNAQMLALERQVEEKNNLLRFHEDRAQQALAQSDTNSGEVARMEERVQAVTAQLEEQKNQVIEYEKRVKELQEELQALQASRTQEEQDLLQSARNEAESRMEALRGEMAALEQQNVFLKEELAQCKTALEEGLEKAAAVENALAEETARYEEAEVRLQGLAAQTDGKEKESAALAGEVEAYKSRVQELEASLQQANQAIQKTKEEGETALRQVREELEEKSVRVDDLASQLGISDGERQEMNTALAEVRKEMEELRATSYDALSEKDAARVQVEELSGKLIQLEDTLKQAPTSEELAALELKYEEERKRADMVQERLDQEMANGTKAGLARQLADVLRDLEEAREEIRRLRNLPQAEAPRESAVPESAVPESGPQEAAGHSWKELFDTMPSVKRKNLGDALVETGIIRQEQLAEAMQTQKMHPEAGLATILLNKKMVPEQDVAEIISLLSDVPRVSLESIDIDAEAAALLPEKIARMKHCIPVRADAEEIEVAMESPMDLVAIEDIERVTNRRVVPKVALRSQIEAALDAVFKPA